MNGAPIGSLDLDQLPTGAAVKVLGAQAIAQQAQILAISADIAEIKTMVASAILVGKILTALVPVVGAIIWAVTHVRLS
jgi:hypothetical protein